MRGIYRRDVQRIPVAIKTLKQDDVPNAEVIFCQNFSKDPAIDKTLVYVSQEFHWSTSHWRSTHFVNFPFHHLLVVCLFEYWKLLIEDYHYICMYLRNKFLIFG